MKELGISPYLRVLRSAACSAAEPPAAASDVIYEARRSAQWLYLPCDHRTSVAPSGRFPSALKRPSGSFVLGTPAFVRARHKMSLIAKWRCDLPWVFLQVKL